MTDLSILEYFRSSHSLLDYIKEHFDLDADFYDTIRFRLGQILYYYGEHFRFPREKYSSEKLSLKKKIRREYRNLYNTLKMRQLNNQKTRDKPKILSNSYFQLNNELNQIGFNVYDPIWSRRSNYPFLGNWLIYKETEELRTFINRCSINEILSKNFQDRVQAYRNSLKEYYSKQNITALIVPFDVPFFENVAIKTFKEIQVPTFIFLHGIPARYNMFDDNRADYLIVWGEFIKDLYIKAGVKEEKIIVAGHPNYKDNPDNDLKFSLSDILVITKCIGGTTGSNRRIMADRGNLLVYLLQIQKVLTQFGIKSVRYRPHPSENPAWYLNALDPKFFKLDHEDYQTSLKKSSLVIGPSSTVFIEALYHGVNYLIFEPSFNNLDMVNHIIVPPYDGSISEVPVAKNMDQLKEILENKLRVNLSIYNRIIKTPFDIRFLKDIIKS